MRIAASEDGETLGETVSISTPQTPQSAIEQFAAIVNDLTGKKDVQKVVGGVAGPLNEERTTLIQSPHLPEWVGFPIKETLEDECRAGVFLQNDTSLVGLGEAVVGAGRDDAIVAYITVSTGVGGVRIVNGELEAARFSFEPGHQIININDFDEVDQASAPHEGDVPGHLEYYISGTNMERRYGEHPRDIEDPEKWLPLEHALVVGLNNVAVFWSPDSIVLGGAMIVKKTGIRIDRVQESLNEILTIYPEAPTVKKATLGDKGGLFGSLEYLKQL